MAGAIVTALSFNDKTLLFGKACFLTSLKYINEDSAARFLQMFDAAAVADVTLGTTKPKWVMTAGANGGDDDAIGSGLKFDKGIVVAGTTTVTGSTLAGASTQHVFGEVV